MRLHGPVLRAAAPAGQRRLRDATSALCAVLVGLTLAADLPRHLHLAHVAHEVCSAHGRVAHHGGESAPHARPVRMHAPWLEPGSAANPGPAAHAHCGAAVGSSGTAAGAPRPAWTPSIRPAEATAPDVRDSLPCPIAILDRAPKASPPARA
jgi:hypothetical protein